MAKPYPLNVEGPFYVEDGCCTSCGIPEGTAPGLFAWSGDGHCFVARQPENPAELEGMVEVVNCAELDCIRYRGADPSILRRLVENGDGDKIDVPVPPEWRPFVRNTVTFAPRPEFAAGANLVEDFVGHLAELNHDRPEPYRYRWRRAWLRPGWGIDQTARIAICWFGNTYHWMNFVIDRGGAVVWHHRRDNHGRGLSRLIHGWVKARPQFAELRWFTADERKAGGEGRRTPF